MSSRNTLSDIALKVLSSSRESIKIIATAARVNEVEKLVRKGEITDKDVDRLVSRLNMPNKEKVSNAIKEYLKTRDEDKLIEAIADAVGIDKDTFKDILDTLALIFSEGGSK